MARAKSEFAELMQRLFDGCERAAEELLDRYGACIRRAVRRQLSNELRSEFDSLDFMQDLWAVFFARLPALKPFDGPQHLIGFLKRVARDKVIDQYRRRVCTSDRRRPRRQSLGHDVSFENPQLGIGPTASRVFSGREEVEKLLKSFPEKKREVVKLRAAGMTFREIGGKLQINECTARRYYHQVQRFARCTRQAESDDRK